MKTQYFDDAVRYVEEESINFWRPVVDFCLSLITDRTKRGGPGYKRTYLKDGTIIAVSYFEDSDWILEIETSFFGRVREEFAQQLAVSEEPLYVSDFLNSFER